MDNVKEENDDNEDQDRNNEDDNDGENNRPLLSKETYQESEEEMDNFNGNIRNLNDSEDDDNSNNNKTIIANGRKVSSTSNGSNQLKISYASSKKDTVLKM